MCGIACSLDGNLPQSVIDKVLNSMKSRGPDEQKFAILGRITMMHTRLSVIDLSLNASQPMFSSCGRYLIVFNGEIYNFRQLREEFCQGYQFCSQSDTEVILAMFAQYGPSSVDMFRGMFALAIWDNLKEELFIARDRLGVKPLYYAVNQGQFFMASRPKALQEMMPNFGRLIDKQSVRFFLEAGYIPAPYSIYQGINKLEPGHYLVINSNGIEKKRYWSIDEIETNASLVSVNEDQLLNELDSLLNESVKLRLISDVPIGAFLSGGIDSSLVVAYMARHLGNNVRTFTMGFENKKFDESTFAASIANHLGANHTSEILSADDLLKLMPKFIDEFDEPFFDYSAFPVMAVSRLARKNVTVSLSGDGGDEAFGGYHYYKLMNFLELIHQLPLCLRNYINLLFKFSPIKKVRWLGKVISADGPASAYAFMRGIMKDSNEIMSLSLTNSTKSLSSLFSERALNFPHDLSYAEIGMRLDIAYTLPDDYLQKVDVGSMAFSLEARDPLLDHKIFEWAAQLPLGWKLKNGINKYLLRKLAYRYIPQDILDRPKMGFEVPMAQWLRSGLKEWGESLMTNDSSFRALGLDVEKVRLMWLRHQQKKIEAHTILWSVLVLLQFHKRQSNPIT
jgi:asparagine synthase (glutamine-hydrolysing)